ncbi:MAG: WD40 repeat protein [Limisphaerales bacterium]|jgi:WD40 repeat protein
MLLLVLASCSDADDPARTWALTSQGIYSAAVSNSGELVVIGSLNHGVISARFSSDETLLAVGHTNRLISLYDVPSGRLLQKWDPGTRHAMRATGAAVIEVGFSSDNRTLLAVTGDGRLLEL